MSKPASKRELKSKPTVVGNGGGSDDGGPLATLLPPPPFTRLVRNI